MIKVRVRKGAHVQEYLVEKGTNVQDVVRKYARDTGAPARRSYRARYRETDQSRLGARYRAVGALTQRSRAPPTRPRPPAPPAPPGFLARIMDALGSRRERPEAAADPERA